MSDEPPDINTRRLANAEVGVLFERDELLLTLRGWPAASAGALSSNTGESWRLTPGHAQDLIAALQESLAKLDILKLPAPSDTPRH